MKLDSLKQSETRHSGTLVGSGVTMGIVSWICRVLAALILFQTLFFKFTGAAESVHIFTQLGVEPWGRYATGIVELVVVVLLLVPVTAWLGALLAGGVMIGAILSHLTRLGIVVQNDGGMLFALALIVFVCAAATTYIHRRQIPFIGSGRNQHRK